MKLSRRQLEKYLDVITEGSGNNLYAICPYCKGKEFGISMDKGHPFGCFRKKKCGKKGNIYTLIKDFKWDIKTYSKSSKLVNPFSKDVEEIGEEKEPITIPKILGYKRIYESDYLFKRGFTKEDLLEHEFGVTFFEQNLLNRVIIPCYVRNELKTYTARLTYNSDVIQKYYNSPFSETSKCVYRLSDVNSDTLIVVEGVFDKIRVYKYLKQLKMDKEISCVCTYGAKVSNYQLKMFFQRGVKSVIFFYEHDVKKELDSAIQKTINYGRFNVFYARYSENIDPDDFTLEQFVETLDNVQKSEIYKKNILL